MILTVWEAGRLKEEIARRFSIHLHFHDGCGGQYFTLDQEDPTVAQDIADFLETKNLAARFTDDGMHFTVEKNTHGK